MIDLWYLNVRNVNHQNVSDLLQYMPFDVASEIVRFRNHSDRKLKLFGKLIVKKYYIDQGVHFNWSEWQLTAQGKPLYNNNGKKFNISHSGDYVVVGFSEKEIGVDIEKLTEFDIDSVITYLHPLEAECITNNPSSRELFFNIWTRKEAYLKAIGKGIIEGLNNENCLHNEIANDEKWYINSFSLFPDYKTALCTKIPNCLIKTRELFLSEFVF